MNTQQQAYVNDFELFLAHTNEKMILLEEIIKEINAQDVSSLLDIGAGNGLLSIPLAAQVKTYRAVESNYSFFEKLKSAGLDVIHGSFPLPVEGAYDMVLLSHALQRYDKASFTTFITEAWKLVAPGGQLLIVTYRGQDDDWTELMQALGRSPSDYNRIGYNDLIMLLNELGEVKMRKVQTTVEAESLEDILNVLGFVAGDGVPAAKADFLSQRATLEKILRSKYYREGRFIFPFWHFFVSAHKR